MYWIRNFFLTLSLSLFWHKSTLSPLSVKPALPARPTICLYVLRFIKSLPTYGDVIITYYCKFTLIIPFKKKKTNLVLVLNMERIVLIYIFCVLKINNCLWYNFSQFLKINSNLVNFKLLFGTYIKWLGN